MRTKLLGIDLSWNSTNNSGIAVGTFRGDRLCVDSIFSESNTHSDVAEVCRELGKELLGVAIDAPLLVPRPGRMRECDIAVGQEFGNRKIGCYPPPRDGHARRFAASLETELGLCHAKASRFIIEVFPHPAIVTIFDLPERLRYKKGRVDEKRSGLLTLREWILKLRKSCVLPVLFSGEVEKFLRADLEELRGRFLKRYEDGLDALICLYVAGLWALDGGKCRRFGNLRDGYIVVPGLRCLAGPG